LRLSGSARGSRQGASTNECPPVCLAHIPPFTRREITSRFSQGQR
jgi:hypothetical protein